MKLRYSKNKNIVIIQIQVASISIEMIIVILMTVKNMKKFYTKLIDCVVYKIILTFIIIKKLELSCGSILLETKYYSNGNCHYHDY